MTFRAHQRLLPRRSAASLDSAAFRACSERAVACLLPAVALGAVACRTRRSRNTLHLRQGPWPQPRLRTLCFGVATKAAESSSPQYALITTGVRVRGGLLEPMVKRGAGLPARATKVFTTTRDDQASADICIYAGERPFCDQACHLASLTLGPLLCPSHCGFLRLEVSVVMQEDGGIVVEAKDMDGALISDTPAACRWEGRLCRKSLTAIATARDTTSRNEIASFDAEMARMLPMLWPVRIVSIGSCEVLIRQVQRRGGAGTGGAVWGSGLVLAELLYKGELQGLVEPGTKSVELGSGPGLVAIALALRGASVLATDKDEASLEGLRANVQRAAPLPGHVMTGSLDWSSSTDRARVAAEGPWDLVVGSDLLYPGNCAEGMDHASQAHVDLLKTLESLTGPRTTVVLALQTRICEVERFLALLDKAKWRCEEWVPPGQPAIAVLQLKHLNPE